MLGILQSQPISVQKKCKGYHLVNDPTEVLVGGNILYFSRDTPPKFKMGGKVTNSNSVYYEYIRRNRTYMIYVHKYIVLYKPPRERRSKQYRLFRSLLESLDCLSVNDEIKEKTSKCEDADKDAYKDAYKDEDNNKEA